MTEISMVVSIVNRVFYTVLIARNDMRKNAKGLRHFNDTLVSLD